MTKEEFTEQLRLKHEALQQKKAEEREEAKRNRKKRWGKDYEELKPLKIKKWHKPKVKPLKKTESGKEIRT